MQYMCKYTNVNYNIDVNYSKPNSHDDWLFFLKGRSAVSLSSKTPFVLNIHRFFYMLLQMFSSADKDRICAPFR